MPFATRRPGVADILYVMATEHEFGPELQQVLFTAYGLDAPDARKLEFHLLLDECF